MCGPVSCERHLHLVAAVAGDLDDHLVGLVGQVAVGIGDADVERVARLDLVQRPGLRDALVGLRLRLLHLLLQLLAERGLLLLELLGRGHFQLAVGGDLDLHVGERHAAELRPELLRVVAADRVAAGQFQDPVVGRGLAQPRVEIGAEQALAGPGAGQVDQFLVAAGLGGDDRPGCGCGRG